MEDAAAASARMVDPVRRALDAILTRWLGIYVLAASVVVGPLLTGVAAELVPLWRCALPVFLLGFITVHLVHRRQEARSDGWRRACEVDAARVAVLMLVGALAVVLVAACLLAIFWPYEDLVEVVLVGAMAPPILVPLYVVSVWVAVDCATRRLARSADEADRALRDYWRDVARR